MGERAKQHEGGVRRAGELARASAGAVESVGSAMATKVLSPGRFDDSVNDDRTRDGTTERDVTAGFFFFCAGRRNLAHHMRVEAGRGSREGDTTCAVHLI